MNRASMYRYGIGPDDDDNRPVAEPLLDKRGKKDDDHRYEAPSLKKDGYDVIARRPCGADPGDIMPMDEASEYEDRQRRFNKLYGDD